jgi:hypothetical protein
MARDLTAIHIPAAFPKLAKEARLFPYIRAKWFSILLFIQCSKQKFSKYKFALTIEKITF